MNLLEQTKKLCKLYNIVPARSRGQNFLIKEKIYDDIMAAADLKPADIVLEVGPGLGFLTAKLAAQVKKVIAVELDDKLVKTLGAGLKARGINNVELINEDILKISNPNNQTKNYKIVANLPYNITSIFLRKFLAEAENKPELMALMLQKEVAERICAKTGSMSLLAVSVQFYAKPEIVQIVKKENFWPEPEVDSAIIKLEVRSKKLEVNEREFFRLVKFGFSAKRKMLKNNLAAGLKISQETAKNKIISAGFNQKIRAQELSVDDWLKLFSVFN
ncbi:MAG: ribosomal RNA small subunit methyltransferase A [Parcubacteria group bacterium]|nr:ribosomal RNA small subunit methyltransferase A [Parcubacteria group bacterium]